MPFPTSSVSACASAAESHAFAPFARLPNSDASRNAANAADSVQPVPCVFFGVHTRRAKMLLALTGKEPVRALCIL